MFLTPPLYRSNAKGQRRPLRGGFRLTQPVQVVPRADCAFRRVNLIDRGRPAMKAARLRLQHEAFAPDSRFRLAVDRQGRGAGAWEYQKSGRGKARLLPETLAREPLYDGVRLVACLEGEEGQVWSGGNLVASRWWDHHPTDNDWARFLRAAQRDANFDFIPVPKAQTVAFRSDIPLMELEREYLYETFSPAKLAAACAVIFGFGYMFMFGKMAHYQYEIQTGTSKLESVSAETEQILSYRRRALANMKDVRKYDALGNKGVLIIGLSDLAGALDGEDLMFKIIRYEDESLDVELVGDLRQSIPELVTAIEGLPSLANVNAVINNRNTIEVRADIDMTGLGGPKQNNKTGAP